jgi:hypothetical protein
MSSDDSFWRLYRKRMKDLNVKPDDIVKSGDGAIIRYERINELILNDE